MKSSIQTWEVYKSTALVGYVKAVSHAQAVARAHGRYGICDVELATQRKARPSDRRNANICQQAKQSRRYPVVGFEARRAALIEEVLAK